MQRFIPHIQYAWLLNGFEFGRKYNTIHFADNQRWKIHLLLGETVKGLSPVRKSAVGLRNEIS